MNGQLPIRQLFVFLVALCSTAASAAPASAAFTLSINGTRVASESGSGVLMYLGPNAGYSVMLMAKTTASTPAVADITSLLMVTNVSGTTATLTITVSEDSFKTPDGLLGASDLSSSLMRQMSPAYGASGTVSMISTAVSASGGGSASTGPITLDGSGRMGSAGAIFNRTSDSYSLSTVFTVSGLAKGESVVLTADSVVTAPAPPAAALMLTALPLLPLVRRFTRRSPVE
jgi:hypothetical protein